MSSLLTPELLAHIGQSAPPEKELVTRRDIRKYSIATNQRLEKYLAGDEAPPMFYVALFWAVVEREQLSPDGVFINTLVPEFPLKRAMAGGLRIEFDRPIHPGDILVATRTLSDIYEKQGSQGPLIFYEITTTVEDESSESYLTETPTRIMR